MGFHLRDFRVFVHIDLFLGRFVDDVFHSCHNLPGRPIDDELPSRHPVLQLAFPCRMCKYVIWPLWCCFFLGRPLRATVRDGLKSLCTCLCTPKCASNESTFTVPGGGKRKGSWRNFSTEAGRSTGNGTTLSRVRRAKA